MMNQTEDRKKNSILKSLAITGFIGIIIVTAWLSVKFVQVLPNAFTSLASMAQSVQNYGQDNQLSDDSVKVTADSSQVNAGDTVNLGLYTEEDSTEDNYAFSYECAEGVAVGIIDGEDELSIDCDTNYELGDKETLTLAIDSEKEHSIDLNYSISQIDSEDEKTVVVASSSIAVINDTIPETNIPAETVLATNEEAGPEVEDNDASSTTIKVSFEETPTITSLLLNETPDEVSIQTVPITPDTKTESVIITDSPTEDNEFIPGKLLPTTATNDIEFDFNFLPLTKGSETVSVDFTQIIPVSDPNGRTDLSTRFLQSGTIVGNLFFSGDIVKNERGAVQFEVMNLGSKTSDEWTYSVTLPGGSVYTSPNQAPLKPNEQAILTIGFPTDSNSAHLVDVRVNEDNDQNILNDRFTKTIAFFN